MAPIEPDLSNSNTRPFIALSAYLLGTTSLVYLVVQRVIYRAYHSLPPSQATRYRQGTRKKQVNAFGALALVSLGVVVYYGYSFLLLSYQVWAYERGERVPTGLWGNEGLFSAGVGELQLGRWFHDTDLTVELWEIAMEKTRRRWWTTQLILLQSPWTLYVALQSQRHAIPHPWAFVLLAPLTSRSFAMNLFFLAVLLTPVPLPEESSALVSVASKPRHGRKSSKTVQFAIDETAARTESLLTRLTNRISASFPRKPDNWVAHPIFTMLPALATLAQTILLSQASNTSAFKSTLTSLSLLTILPLVLPRVLPLSAGHSAASPSLIRTRALTAFRLTSLLTTVIHFLFTLLSLIDNDPGAHRHRHSLLHIHLDAERSRTARTRSAFARIIGALTDHPSVGRIGFDVILCALSLAAWATMRGIHPQHILRAAGLVGKSELEAAAEMKDAVQREVKSLISSATASKHDRFEDEVEETPLVKKGRKRAAGTKGRKEREDSPEAGAGEKGRAAAAYEAEGADEAGASAAASLLDGEEREAEWESGALAWGVMVLGGLATGAGGVLGAEVGT